MTLVKVKESVVTERRATITSKRPVQFVVVTKAFIGKGFVHTLVGKRYLGT
jgi:hypothetical protein